MAVAAQVKKGRTGVPGSQGDEAEENTPKRKKGPACAGPFDESLRVQTAYWRTR